MVNVSSAVRVQSIISTFVVNISLAVRVQSIVSIFVANISLATVACTEHVLTIVASVSSGISACSNVLY